MKKYPLLIFVIIVLFPFLLFPPLKKTFHYVAKPFLSAGAVVSDKLISSPLNFFSGLASVHQLLSENQRLQGRVRQLEAEQAALKEMERENADLKKQLGYLPQNNKKHYLPAYIIGKNPTISPQFLIIDKGSRDGLKIGQSVVSEDILIGYLAEVNLTSSRVSLITNPNSAVPVLMQESRASGLVRGAIGYGLVLEDVTKDSPLKEGENIITSGLGGQYPRGLLVGKLEKVISSPADLFQKASVKMLIEIEKLERVFVISEE